MCQRSAHMFSEHKTKYKLIQKEYIVVVKVFYITNSAVLK